MVSGGDVESFSSTWTYSSEEKSFGVKAKLYTLEVVNKVGGLKLDY